MINNPSPTMSDSAGVPASAEPTSAIDKFSAASIVATGVDPDEAISAMDASARPALLYALDLLSTHIGTWRRCAIAHLIADGALGQDFTFDGKPFRFEAERRGEMDDLAGLFYYLSAVGVSVSDLGSAASGARVTDLERLAGALPEDVRQDALDTIRAHRVYKDGSPKLVDRSEKAAYRKKR